jgi:hypothetical protein
VTEAEWLAGTNAQEMLETLRDKVSERKLRLFMVACCRRVWHTLDEEDDRQPAVEVAERFADGLADAGELADQFGELTDGCPVRIWDDIANASVADFVEFDAISCAQAEAHEAAHKACWASGEEPDEPARQAEEVAQIRQVHDIFGNPFRALAIDPAILTADVAALARAAYEERSMPSGELDQARLAVLADALEEAGAAAELLDHLRGPGPHVRGCFAVDLCLGRS